ncbi:MAG TPA: hypothetical protein VN372_04655 [Methanospirillum sp.]|nr:hypothetical protein [Methanospirillum sp.]
MNWFGGGAGVVFFVLASLAGADYIATTIITDGSAMLSSSVQDENGSYDSRVMTEGSSRLSRTMRRDPSVGADLSVRGAGPILFAEYASGIQRASGPAVPCAFIDQVPLRATGFSSRTTSGILHTGEYASSRLIEGGISGETVVAGPGMVVLGSDQERENISWHTRDFVSGSLNVSDVVRFGGRL